MSRQDLSPMNLTCKWQKSVWYLYYNYGTIEASFTLLEITTSLRCESPIFFNPHRQKAFLIVLNIRCQPSFVAGYFSAINYSKDSIQACQAYLFPGVLLSSASYGAWRMIMKTQFKFSRIHRNHPSEHFQNQNHQTVSEACIQRSGKQAEGMFYFEASERRDIWIRLYNLALW